MRKRNQNLSCDCVILPLGGCRQKQSSGRANKTPVRGIFTPRKYFHLKCFSCKTPLKFYFSFKGTQTSFWIPRKQLNTPSIDLLIQFDFHSYGIFCCLAQRVLMPTVWKASYWKLLWKTWFQIHPTILLEICSWVLLKNKKRSTKTEQDAGDDDWEWICWKLARHIKSG